MADSFSNGSLCVFQQKKYVSVILSIILDSIVVSIPACHAGVRFKRSIHLIPNVWSHDSSRGADR